MGHGSRRSLVVAVYLAACLLWAPTEAQVLTTITIDGDMSDWTAVLADTWQTARDGPSAGIPDRDAPVPSTGRDLLTFAWTYDSSHLFLYVERVASESNRQRFWFYVDSNDDGLQQSGEPVIAVSWLGANRRTDVELYGYVASTAAGDPLGDPAGFADGWTMPGTLALIRSLESVRGGSASGLEMESRVSWIDLGIPPGQPVRFHVSSSNSSNVPAQIDDNMGGPGGLVGTTRFAGIRIDPRSVTATTVPGGTAALAHTITNTGRSDDRVSLSWSSSGAFVPNGVTFWLDSDGDGAVGPGDTPLTDGDGDGLPDHGPIPAGAGFDVVVAVDAPSTATDGASIGVDVVARSLGAPVRFDVVSDVVTIRSPGLTLVKSVDRTTAAPGEVLTYRVTYTSTGTVDAHQVVLVDPVPAEVDFVPGSTTGTNTVTEFSHDGGATFDDSEVPPVTHIRWSLTAPLAPGDSGAVSFQARIR